MKHIKLLFLLLLTSSISIGQTIYNESFDNDLNKGAVYNTSTASTDIDVSGVNWTIDVSGTNFDSNGDRFQVVNNANRYLEGRDLDGPAIWYSPVININGFTGVEFTLEASENQPTNNQFNPADTFTTEYRLDGGAWTFPNVNGTLSDDLPTTTLVEQNIPFTGTTLEIRVTMNNNANNERYRLDNILVTGTAPTTPTITVNPSTYLVSGLSYVEGNVSLLPETFTVQGSALTNDIIITAPSSFEIATTANGPYSSSITLAQASGVVNLTTIYTKLTYGLTVGNYNENIDLSSTGATTVLVNAIGDVLPYTAPTDCNELFISEYHEAGPGTPDEQYIELYNPSSSPISLDNYQLARFRNGRVNHRPDIRTLPSGQTIAPYSTYIIARNNSELCNNGTADYCITSATINFDGNDVMALQNSDGANIDVVGVLNVNNTFGQNVDLVRDQTVQAPNTTYTVTEWTSVSSNNITKLGSHINDCSCTGAIVTWDGSNWSNGTGPDATTPAEINGLYNIGVGTATSFTACSLTINANVIIAANTYIEVENNITNNAKVIIQDQGSFVQNNESSIFINNSTETYPVEVIKRTAPLVAWYEYTYWGSPLVDALIEDLVPNTANNRKFIFNGANFNDNQAEDPGNNNTFTVGQDDIDDDGDDWQYTSGVMTPGVGYATTMAPIDLAGPGATGGINLTFYGSAANSGKIVVPITRNDNFTVDNNWQFIGNPYPSAIDANAFFTENTILNTVDPGAIDGAIYFWSQATPPNATTIGNQQINFSVNDYAIINFSANIAGERYAPNGYIPSGQGFFVNYSDTFGSATGTVTFSNSMRVTGNNDQFFRSDNSTLSEKLWLNLTTDNGVFSQIAIAYIDGATNNDDGPSFDARRFYSGGSAMLVSFAENSTTPLAIQGKQTNTLDYTEVIPLGLKTGITSPTIYTISIDQLQGDFLSNNAIYLKDNLTNTYQDLSVADYSFTSDVGEFNNRFEVVFTQPSLSISEQLLTSNSLSIIENENDQVTFKLTSDILTIKNIKIYDVLGRLLYDLKTQNKIETFNLSSLSKTTYIAQVELSNGIVISKKAIKK